MEITREQLCAYLEDALGAEETSRVEQALRCTESLRKELRALMHLRDRGEHSLGAIWRRSRLSCPSREQLGSFLLKVVEPAEADYIEFHLKTVGCSYCLANLVDLENQQEDDTPEVQGRRKRIFESSAGLLKR